MSKGGCAGGALPVPIPLTPPLPTSCSPEPKWPLADGPPGRSKADLHQDQGAPKIPEIRWKAFFMPNGAAKEQPEKCILIYLLAFLVF